MTARERVLRTLNFQPTDRVACDLMEGHVWPELMQYFQTAHGLKDAEEAIEYLDTDFRWIRTVYTGPRDRLVWCNPRTAAGWMDLDEKEKISVFQKCGIPEELLEGKSKDTTKGPLSAACSVADIEKFTWPDPQWWQPGDFAQARKRWPDHVLVFYPRWMPLFWDACEAFGMEEALINMACAPAVFEAFIRRHHAFYMGILKNGVAAARGVCDIVWLGDDYASQQAMIMSPDLWRKFIKPYLVQQVRLVRDNGMYVFFHSCGAVRDILPDLIEIGVNTLVVFQTTAVGMDPESIAAEFGGRLAFYGGLDVQQLLCHGTVEEVKAQVRANVKAFSKCGGYIAANSHCGVTLKWENLLAIYDEVRK